MIFLCFCISLNMFIVLPCCVLNCLVAWTLSTCNYWFLLSCPSLASKFNAYGNISGTKCHRMSFSCMIRINCFDFLVETGRVRSLLSQIFIINYLVVLTAGYVSSIIVYLFIVVRCDFLFWSGSLWVNILAFWCIKQLQKLLGSVSALSTGLIGKHWYCFCGNMFFFFVALPLCVPAALLQCDAT